MPDTWIRSKRLNVHIINRLTQKLGVQVVGQNLHLDTASSTYRVHTKKDDLSVILNLISTRWIISALQLREL